MESSNLCSCWQAASSPGKGWAWSTPQMRKAGANVRKELSLQPSIYSSTTRSLHLLLILFHHQIPPSLPALESSKERILGRETRLLHWLLHNAETDTGLHVELAALYIAKINGDCQRFGFRIDPPSNLFLKPPSLPGSLNMCGWFFFLHQNL